MITCTIECRQGYEFSERVREEYTCGEETNYRWEHQTSWNPNAKLPDCVKLQQVMDATGVSTVDYPTAFCSDPTAKAAILEEFTRLLTASRREFECLMLGTCEMDSVEVLNCDVIAFRRVARMAETGVTVAVMSRQNMTYGSENETQPLDNFLEIFDKLVQEDQMVISIDDTLLEPNKTSVHLDAFENCPPGTIPAVQYGYCVPCGPGTYYSKLDGDLEFECNPCPVDTYQEETGQTECLPCPNGTVTAEPYSTNASDCYIPEVVTPEPPVTPGPGLDRSTIIIISVCSVAGFLLILAGLLACYMLYYRPRAKVSTVDEDVLIGHSYAMQPTGSVDPGSSGSLTPEEILPASHTTTTPTPTVSPVPRPKSAFDVDKPLEEFVPPPEACDTFTGQVPAGATSVAASASSAKPPQVNGEHMEKEPKESLA